jgi:hypothetical protein
VAPLVVCGTKATIAPLRSAKLSKPGLDATASAVDVPAVAMVPEMSRPRRSRRSEIGEPTWVQLSSPPSRMRIRVRSVQDLNKELSEPNRAAAGAGKHRQAQRPALGRRPNGPPDRRSGMAGTRVGGLLPLRPGVRVPPATSRSGARSAGSLGASGSARTFAIQPRRGFRDCMVKENTKQPTGPLRHPC